jgi:hypothetical protein
MAHKIGHGVSGTTNQGYGQNGSLKDILSITSGSADSADKAMAFANQFAPLAPKADPWEAAFQFFAEMGRQASVPGSTALGAAVGSLQAPMDYLTAKKKELRDSEAARTQMALTVGAGLKKPTGSAVKVIGPDGKPIFMSTEEAIKTNAVPYFEPKSGGKTSLATQDYIVTAENGITIGDKLFPKDSKVQLTDQQRALFGPADLYTAPTGGDDGDPSSALSKLYKDLENATEGGPEALALQSQINALITKSGFDKEIFDAENEILTSYNKATKSIKESRINYAKMEEAVKSADGPGDLALVFSFMKMLDPGSVVRESEFSAAQNTAGLFQKLEVAAENIKKGDLLSPKQRQSFLELSKKFLEGGNNSMIKIRRDKGIQANNYGLNAANIFGYELAPAKWYISEEAYEIAEAAGTTVEAAWLNKNDAEQAAWIAENGGS